MQHTPSGWIHVEAWTQEIVEKKAIVEIVVQDSGIGMSNEKLDALFRDLEQVSTDEQENGDPKRAKTSVLQSSESQSSSSRALGLGLAMVARIVRNMDGQLRLKSEEGKGSRFVIQLPFILSDDKSSSEESQKSTLLRMNSASPISTPQASEGEVTLVDKASSTRLEGAGKNSSEDVSSLHSFKSASSNRGSAKSDVDRLIDAISGPLTVDEAGNEDKGLRQTNSKGSGHSRKGAASASTMPVQRESQETSSPIKRAWSYGGSQDSVRSPSSGSELITDTKTPIKAVRMPDEFNEVPAPSTPHVASRILFEISNKQGTSEGSQSGVLDAETSSSSRSRGRSYQQ